MPRRAKTRPVEDLMDLVAMLPWWAGAVLALLSYLLLHSVASPQLVPSRARVMRTAPAGA
jgi:restriction system protein